MFQLAIRMDVFLRAFKIASIVGIVLAIINRGDHILFGTMTFNSWIKILKTFFGFQVFELSGSTISNN